MNIKVQACGFVLLVILYLLYHQQHTLQTYSQRAFLRFYAVTVLCILMDILSIVAIESASHLPALFVTFVCKTYLITLVLTALCGVMYIGVDILLSNKAFRKTEHLILLITSVICLSIYLLPISIYCDPVTHIVYTYGSSALMTYLGAVGLILLNFALILKYRRQIRVRRRTGMLLWMLVWILSAIIQFLNPEILVVGFGSCLGVVIIYLQFENPEINLDRASGMYNQTAFYEFIHQIYYDRSAYTAFVFINDHRFSGDDSQQTMQDLAKKLLSTDGAYIFKTADDEIVMLTPASMWNHADTASIQKFALDTYLSASSDSNLKILFLEDCLLTPCQEDFFSLLRYCRRTKIKQTVQRFIPVDSSVAAHMYAENDLIQKIDDAISQNRIEVFFQPIYSTRQKAFTCAEALVRMYDAHGNLLPVYDSICAAEESGRIHQIGEIVFEKVCHAIRNEQLAQYGLHYIEVNLSVAQCSDEKLAERYIRIMERYQIDPSNINLEITESATMEMKQTLLANMEKLIAYGVSFSLDDFGTGQSNLNYIVEMPVQIVKFDRVMTQAYFSSQKGRFVMNAAMHMIQDMKLGIVSEGIETQEQLTAMEQLGIDYIQGFYFSKPLPLPEFLAFIKKQECKRTLSISAAVPDPV